MKISQTNPNFGAKWVLPKSKHQTLKKLKTEEGELDKFFRDGELFNPEKDELTADYSQYDIDDLGLHIKKYDPDYHMQKKGEITKFDRMV